LSIRLRFQLLLQLQSHDRPITGAWAKRRKVLIGLS
jgi:hypothetical protein